MVSTDVPFGATLCSRGDTSPLWDIPLKRMPCLELMQIWVGHMRTTCSPVLQVTSWSKMFASFTQALWLLCVCVRVVCVPSTGGTDEPGKENCGGVKDLLPAPPPCRPPLLQEVQVSRSCGGSGDHMEPLPSWIWLMLSLQAPWSTQV